MLYNLCCNSCEHTFEIATGVENYYSILCPKCGEKARVLITGSNYHPFPAGWWEHIGPQPLHISSRSQLRDECEKNNVYATYLDPPISFDNRTRITRSQH